MDFTKKTRDTSLRCERGAGHFAAAAWDMGHQVIQPRSTKVWLAWDLCWHRETLAVASLEITDEVD